MSLLPSIFNHNAVEKVILCVSDLLHDYVNTLFYQEYLSQIGDIMQGAGADTELLKRQIRHIVESASKNPDFHHVMTEIALLNSSLSQHAQSQKLSRIIPIELSGNLDNIFLLSFLPSTTVVIKYSNDKDSLTTFPRESQHKKFFQLLRRLFESQESVLKAFEDVYDQCIKDPWQDKEMFRNHVLSSFFQANNKLSQDDIGSEAFHEFLKRQRYSSDQIGQIVDNTKALQHALALDREIKCQESLLLPGMNYDEQKNQNPKCIKDTGRWALDHVNYTQWRDIGEKKLLWILADPGYGKSVLCRTIVDDDLPTHTANTSVIHFIFKDTNDDQRSARAALLSLMHQSISQRRSLIKHALPLCNKAAIADAEFHTLWRLFTNMIQDPQTGNVICVLDALDECKQAWCDDLISSIGHFNSSEEQSLVSNLRFLLTSRPYLHLKHAIGATAHKSMVISLDGDLLSELEEKLNWSSSNG